MAVILTDTPGNGLQCISSPVEWHGIPGHRVRKDGFLKAISVPHLESQCGLCASSRRQNARGNASIKSRRLARMCNRTQRGYCSICSPHVYFVLISSTGMTLPGQVYSERLWVWVCEWERGVHAELLPSAVIEVLWIYIWIPLPHFSDCWLWSWTGQRGQGGQLWRVQRRRLLLPIGAGTLQVPACIWKK